MMMISLTPITQLMDNICTVHCVNFVASQIFNQNVLRYTVKGLTELWLYTLILLPLPTQPVIPPEKYRISLTDSVSQKTSLSGTNNIFLFIAVIFHHLFHYFVQGQEQADRISLGRSSCFSLLNTGATLIFFQFLKLFQSFQSY